MATDRWVIAYDVDLASAEAAEQAGGVTTMTVYNRIRACLRQHGFSEFQQLSVYSMPDEDNSLVRIFQAVNALRALDVSVHIKRLHVFKIDGALNDVLPMVRDIPSAGADD